MTAHWISTKSFTVMVTTDGPTIISAAPLVRRFIGQPIGNLLNWSRRYGELRHETWPVEEGVQL